MYVIKRTDTNEYFQEWGWMNNPWDAEQYTKKEAEAGVLFFSELNISCEIMFLE